MNQRISLLLILLFTFASAKASLQYTEAIDTILPTVFVIGEHESAYQALLDDYQTLLLTACNDDMTTAFDKWKSFLEGIESYGEKVGYDLNGVKIWVNVFWNKDGSVRHFAYYFKPISKNMDFLEFNAFIESFLLHYDFPFRHSEQFSHYGTATFPLVSRVLLRRRG